MCANAHNHRSTLLNYLFGSDVILNMSWFSTKLFVINCASSLSNLSILDQSVYFWSFVLEIIIPLLSKHRIIQMFHNMMSVRSFFLWLSTNTHTSSVVDRPIHCWILSDSVLHIQSPCEFFPWYIVPPVNCIICLANHALLSSLWYLLLKLVVYVSRSPYGLKICLL